MAINSVVLLQIGNAIPVAGLFVNGQLIDDATTMDCIDALHIVACNLGVALGTKVVVYPIAARERFHWESLLTEVAPELDAYRAAAPVPMAYMWTEGGIGEDTQDGPGEDQSYIVYSDEPPLPGTPYTVLTEAYSIAANGETSVQVKHWDCYHSELPTAMTHLLDVDDQRQTHGQLYATVGAMDGNLDDMISITMEVNTNPLTGLEHVPCVHVHFDGDAVACSLFKVGDNILIRPETRVVIEPFHGKAHGVNETLYWMKDEV